MTVNLAERKWIRTKSTKINRQGNHKIEVLIWGFAMDNLFLQISGVGEVKAARYGKELLEDILIG